MRRKNDRQTLVVAGFFGILLGDSERGRLGRSCAAFDGGEGDRDQGTVRRRPRPAAGSEPLVARRAQGKVAATPARSRAE